MRRFSRRRGRRGESKVLKRIREVLVLILIVRIHSFEGPGGKRGVQKAFKRDGFGGFVILLSGKKEKARKVSLWNRYTSSEDIDERVQGADVKLLGPCKF